MMEKPEYQVKYVPEARFAQKQLNEMYDEGYEFVTWTVNIVGEKTYNWFFKGNGQEREMKIKNSDEIEEAIKLIKKSYELAE